MPDLAEKPKRLSLSQILEAMLQRGTGASESVVLRRNAKGETQPEVTAVVGEGETLADAADRAAAVYTLLTDTFGPVSPPTLGEGDGAA